MSTSVERRPFCSSANASSNRQSDNDACSTSNKPPNINPADEPNPPLSYTPSVSNHSTTDTSRGLAATPDRRLARAVPGRPGAAGSGIHDPLLGAGVAALADAQGAPRRSATVARLGADDRSQGDHAAGYCRRGGEDALG